MFNYKPKIQPDTLDELGDVLLKREKLALVHSKLKSMPNYANKDMHFCTIERRIRSTDVQIQILLSRLILLG